MYTTKQQKPQQSRVINSVCGVNKNFNIYVSQLLRKANTFTPAYSIPSAGMENVVYKRDNVGNIDFNKPYSYVRWTSPILSRAYSLRNHRYKKEFGITKSGNVVHIKFATRNQHYSIAERVSGLRRGGNQTWHHLTNRYDMLLVRTDVHSKFGHNGGYYFWRHKPM